MAVPRSLRSRSAPWPPVAATGSVEACLKTKIPTNQLNCLSRLAKERGDVEACLRAEQARDPVLCQRIPAEDSAPEGVFQETCRAHLAVTLKRPELCQGIENEIIKSACGPGD